MKDNNEPDDRKDNEIDVEAVDTEYGPENMPSIPEQLRMLADRLDEDDDTQLVCGIVGVDMREDGDGTAVYNFHLTDGALDDLTAEQTLSVAERYNRASIDNAFKVGLRDALAGPLSDLPKPTAVGRVTLSDVMGGGGPGGDAPSGLGDFLDSVFGDDADDGE